MYSITSLSQCTLRRSLSSLQKCFVSSVPSAPHRSCPISYSISPTSIRKSKDINTQVLFVVGGLYGNVEALDAIEKRISDDGSFSHSDEKPLVVFNGDFNFLNSSPDDWLSINNRGASIFSSLP